MMEDELVAILPADCDFDGDAYPVELFEGTDFLMPSLGFELDILPIFTANGLKVAPNILRTNLDDASMASMVEHGLGVYDDMARFSGAGTLVPITGFANSVVAPAIEYKTEGMILGTAAKMFIISGPVIVYGISSGVIYGILLLIFGAV